VVVGGTPDWRVDTNKPGSAATCCSGAKRGWKGPRLQNASPHRQTVSPRYACASVVGVRHVGAPGGVPQRRRQNKQPIAMFQRVISITWNQGNLDGTYSIWEDCSLDADTSNPPPHHRPTAAVDATAENPSSLPPPPDHGTDLQLLTTVVVPFRLRCLSRSTLQGHGASPSAPPARNWRGGPPPFASAPACHPCRRRRLGGPLARRRAGRDEPWRPSA